jgi:hypothetical protein
VKRVRVAIVAALAVAVSGPGVADAAGPGDALSFRASVTPRTHLFGDPVTAEVQAVAPTEAAAGMTIRTDFAPYVIVGPVEVTRAPAGAQTEVRWRWHLECLTRACLPGETQRRVVFGPAKITVPVDGKSELATATWPIVIVRSRLGPEDRARPEQRASIYPVGDPTQRIGAATLERILWAAAIVVALSAFALMLPFVRRIPRPRRGFERLGSAQRALVLARGAASRDDPSRRRTALERLGRELGRSGSPELADEATRLAWAESPPASDAMTGLVGRAEHELGGRR